MALRHPRFDGCCVDDVPDALPLARTSSVCYGLLGTVLFWIPRQMLIPRPQICFFLFFSFCSCFSQALVSSCLFHNHSTVINPASALRQLTISCTLRLIILFPNACFPPDLFSFQPAFSLDAALSSCQGRPAGGIRFHRLYAGHTHTSHGRFMQHPSGKPASLKAATITLAP